MRFAPNPTKKDLRPDDTHLLAQKLAGRLLRAQRRLADYLNRRTRRVPLVWQKWYLVVFCLQLGSASLYLILDALWQTPQKEAVITIDRLSRPRPTSSATLEPLPLSREDNPPELRRITQFRQYLDSLRYSPGGRQLYEDLVQSRPGLLDSLALVQQLIPSLQTP